MSRLRKGLGCASGFALILASLPACKGGSSTARATRIAAGADHACALLETGRVECWGLDDRGQLGQPPPAPDAGADGGATLEAGTAADSGAPAPPDAGSALDAGVATEAGTATDGGVPLPVQAPVQVEGLVGAEAVAAGVGFSCALLSAGGVRCWGDNSQGQLGSNLVKIGGYSATPVTVRNVSNATSLVAGTSHGCARMADGSATCWGKDDAGQLGDATQPLQGVTAIAAGARHTCAVVNGGVVCWGDNTDGQLGAPDGNPVKVLGGVVDIAAGGNETCALRGDGSVLCWGSLDATCKSGCGEPPTPVDLGGTAKKIAVGSLSACALMEAGGVQCWDRTGTLRFVKGLSSAKDIAVAGGFGCAVLDDASVACWGDNSAGQLGDGTTTPHAGQLVQVKL